MNKILHLLRTGKFQEAYDDLVQNESDLIAENGEGEYLSVRLDGALCLNLGSDADVTAARLDAIADSKKTYLPSFVSYYVYKGRGRDALELIAENDAIARGFFGIFTYYRTKVKAAMLAEDRDTVEQNLLPMIRLVNKRTFPELCQELGTYLSASRLDLVGKTTLTELESAILNLTVKFSQMPEVNHLRYWLAQNHWTEKGDAGQFLNIDREFFKTTHPLVYNYIVDRLTTSGLI